MQALLKDSLRKGILLKPVALAIALALPNVAPLAASMKDVVSTRAAQGMAEQYGRDSLYAFSPDAKRFKSGQNPTNSGKAASSSMPNSPHSVDLLPANRPQAYGRAGGYVGWERVVMMQKNAPGRKDNFAALPAGDHIYRRKSGEEVNADLPATNEGEGQSAASANAIPEANRPRGLASAGQPEPTRLRFEVQLAAPVQPADHLSAMEHPSGGHDHPNTEAQREPDPFIAEEYNSATARRESGDMSATDNGSSNQSDLVVRTLPEQAPLRPDDEGYLNVENHQFDLVPADTSRGTSGTDTASLDEADASSEIVVPLTAPSEGERDSPAVPGLREEPARGASGAQDTPEAEITVSVVSEESAVEAIRMSKRVK